MNSLQTITVPPQSNQPPKGLIMILHGWGASAQDVAALSSFSHLPDFQFVFPDAPFPHAYSSSGRAWYDFPNNFSFQSSPEFRDRPDLSSSRQLLQDLIKMQSEQTGVPLSKIILGGFSQGGAMTLDVGIDLPLAGLMVLSGYLHAPLQPQRSSLPPALVVHGRQDTVVPLTAAHQVRDRLVTLGVPLTYEEYNMGHEIQPIVLTQMQTFVNTVIS
jgi:phospholipase/carboxylesterase